MRFLLEMKAGVRLRYAMRYFLKNFLRCDMRCDIRICDAMLRFFAMRYFLVQCMQNLEI
jgi:hypothetical protein